MSARAAVTTTPYGEVDAAALEGLQSHYDTTQVLDAVDTLDELRTGLNESALNNSFCPSAASRRR